MPSIFNKKKAREKKVEQVEASANGQQLILAEQLTVTKELGEGQYGNVQLGEWKSQNGQLKYVAIKSMKNTQIDGVLGAMLTEAATMQKLVHPHIVTLFGISLPMGEEPFKLVTEYAAWGSLEENLKKKKNESVCQVSTLSKFAGQVALGMQYLAKQQLVHRDLATRNILVFSPELVKISDFGLARTLEGDKARQITGHLKMAVAWLPPEAIQNSIFTPASDVWSYGVTLWEMFTFGKQPFGEIPLQQVKQIVATDPVKHLSKPFACPDAFYGIMLSCWERDPERRPTFEVIYDRVSKNQPKDGVTTVGHDTAEEGHLRYKLKQKVTLISRCEDGMLLVQHESGSVGKVDAKNLNFSAKAVQAVNGHSKLIHTISGPYDIEKMDPQRLITKLEEKAKKSAPGFTRENNPTAVGKKQIDNKEDGVVKPTSLYDLQGANGSDEEEPAYTDPLYPDPYPNIGNRRDSPEEYERLKAADKPLSPVVEPIYSNSSSDEPIYSNSSSNVNGEYEAIRQDYAKPTTGCGALAHKNESEYTSMGYQDTPYTSMEWGAGPSDWLENGRGDEPVNISGVLPDDQGGDTCSGYKVLSTIHGGNEYAPLKSGVRPSGFLEGGNEEGNASVPRTPRSDKANFESEVHRTEQEEHDYDLLNWDRKRLGHGRTQSECEMQRKEEDENENDVLWHLKGLTIGSAPGLTTFPLGKKPPPEVPVRVDLINGRGCEPSQGASTIGRYTTTSRRPVPLPRQKKPRPSSDGFQNTIGDQSPSPQLRPFSLMVNGNVPPLQRGESPRLLLPYNAEGAGVNQPKVEKPFGHSDGWPDVAPGGERAEESECSSTSEVADRVQHRSKKHYIVCRPDLASPSNGATHSNETVLHHNTLQYGSQVQEPEADPLYSEVAALQAQGLQLHETAFPLIDFSEGPSENDAPPSLPPKIHCKSDPIYDKPLTLPPSPHIAPERLNQPPPSPRRLFRGSLAPEYTGNLDWARPFEGGGTVPTGVTPLHGDNRDDPQDEEIKNKIQQIQEECDNASFDFCYAAFLHCQENVEKTVKYIKVSLLVETSGKSEEICERTLIHCGWNLNRAANFIMDNDAEKETENAV